MNAPLKNCLILCTAVQQLAGESLNDKRDLRRVDFRCGFLKYCGVYLRVLPRQLALTHDVVVLSEGLVLKPLLDRHACAAGYRQYECRRVHLRVLAGQLALTDDVAGNGKGLVRDSMLDHPTCAAAHRHCGFT